MVKSCSDHGAKFVNRRQPDQIFTPVKQNFKVYADHVLTLLSSHRVLTVLDSDAGPTFFQIDAL